VQKAQVFSLYVTSVCIFLFLVYFSVFSCADFSIQQLQSMQLAYVHIEAKAKCVLRILKAKTRPVGLHLCKVMVVANPLFM